VALVPDWRYGLRLYVCGGMAYMDAVFAAARARGWPDEALSREVFSVPEPPDYVNHPFTLRLRGSGRLIAVPPDRTATDALAEAGIVVQMKCSDGICGVCAARHSGGTAIEHRDYVLSAREREDRVILCCSRPVEADAVLEVDL
jgi:ferredoxin